MQTAKTENGPGARDREKQDHDITLVIQTIKGEKSKDFLQQKKVSEVIEWAVSAFGFVLKQGDRLFLVRASDTSEKLDENRTLVSYHLQEGERLILTIITSGV